jgi:hypothetical protein
MIAALATAGQKAVLENYGQAVSFWRREHQLAVQIVEQVLQRSGDQKKGRDLQVVGAVSAAMELPKMTAQAANDLIALGNAYMQQMAGAGLAPGPAEEAAEG